MPCQRRSKNRPSCAGDAVGEGISTKVWSVAWNALAVPNDYKRLTVRPYMQPIRLEVDEFSENEQCYFCSTPVPESGTNQDGEKVIAPGIIWYRAKTGMRWETVAVCELCWRVAEEVRGWDE